MKHRHYYNSIPIETASDYLFWVTTQWVNVLLFFAGLAVCAWYMTKFLVIKFEETEPTWHEEHKRFLTVAWVSFGLLLSLKIYMEYLWVKNYLL